MRRILLLSLLVVSVPACDRGTAPPAVTASAQDRAFDVLLGLIRNRLEVMHDVARWKWARKAAIEDPEREAALLLDVAEKGIPLGLDREMTLAFFRGQIEAAKVIQRADFSRWEASGRGAGRRSPRPRRRPQAADRRPEPRLARRAGRGQVPITRWGRPRSIPPAGGSTAGRRRDRCPGPSFGDRASHESCSMTGGGSPPTSRCLSPVRRSANVIRMEFPVEAGVTVD
jgi:chorismate mutase-like protein